MGNLGNLGANSAKLHSLKKMQQKLSDDLQRALKRGDDKEIRKIQREMTNVSQQITKAEGDTRAAAERIPKRF